MAARRVSCFKVCCIVFAVIFVLVVAVSCVAFLYSPDAVKMADKLSKMEGITVNSSLEEGSAFTPEGGLLLVGLSSVYAEANGEGAVPVAALEFYSTDVDSSDENYAHGILLYTDSLEEAWKTFLQVYTNISESGAASEDVSDPTAMICFARGKAVYFGNAAGLMYFYGKAFI